MIKRRSCLLPVAAILAAAASIPALAQVQGSTPNSPSVFSGTITGTYTLGGTPTINATGTYDLSTTGAATRYNLWSVTLSPSVDTTNIWENNSCFLTLNGPGHANGEINCSHSNFIVASGAFSAQFEGYESKLQNSGTVTEWNGGILIPQNNAGGTATRLYGAKCQLTQANASAGAVNTYACIDNEAMAGGGSQPTGNLFLRNADANAYIGTLGHINIGTLTDQTFPLYVQGGGNTSGTFSLVIKNSSNANEFFCQDDSSCTAAGVLTINGLEKLPNVATGTPAASLCIDASNNVIKKTTTGSCV